MADKSYHLKQRMPDTVVELVDTYFPAGKAMPMKFQMVLINGTPVLVEKDGIDVDITADHGATVVTVRLLASRVELRGYKDSDLQWLDENRPVTEIHHDEVARAQQAVKEAQQHLADVQARGVA